MSDTYNITLFNTDTVIYNDGTNRNVDKIVLNGQTVWVTKPANVKATFDVRMERADQYVHYSWGGRADLDRDIVFYPLNGLRAKFFVTGNGVRGDVGSEPGNDSGTYGFPVPTLTNGGMGYVPGKKYKIDLPSSFSRFGFTYNVRSRTGGTKIPLEIKVTKVTTPLGIDTTNTSHYGAIKEYSWTGITLAGYDGNYTMVAWNGSFRRGGNQIKMSTDSALPYEANRRGFTVDTSQPPMIRYDERLVLTGTVRDASTGY